MASTMVLMDHTLRYHQIVLLLKFFWPVLLCAVDTSPTAPLMQTVSEGSEGAEDDHEDDDDAGSGHDDVITQGLKGTAAAFKTIPATGANLLDKSSSSNISGRW